MDLTYKQFIDNILQTRGRFNCGEEYHKRHHILPKGKIVSEETKEKMRKNHADYSNGNHPMYGKHHTEQSKRNMSAGQQNRSKQWRQRQSEAQKGKKHTQEWKDMMSKRNKLWL